MRVADNLDALGNRPEAIRRLSNIVTTNPTDVDAISVLGDLLRTDKQYQAAADAYTKALGVTGGTTPGDWRFYYVRGIAYERSDQFPLAEKDFLKALDLNPDQPQVLNYLGYSWVDKGMNLDPRAGHDPEGRRTPRPTTATSSTASAGPTTASAAIADAVTELEQAVDAPAQRSRDQRPSRRCLLARRPQARGAFPVERRLLDRHRRRRQGARRSPS